MYIKMVKINYVIATYAGYCKRGDSFVTMSEILRSHLIQLHEIRHNLSQITIMKAECTGKQIEGYYDIQDIVKKLDTPVVEIDCENFGYSNSQFLTAYEKYGKEFDYYIFTEDDYCPNMNFFDTFLLKYYNKHFPSNIGKLCSYVQGRPLQKNNKYPIHWTGDIFLSVETLDKLYSNDIFKGEVKQHLDILNKNINLVKKEDINILKGVKKGYIGGYYQLILSYLFYLSEIPIIDYLSEKMNFVYWHDTKKTYGGLLKIISKNNIAYNNAFIYIKNNELYNLCSNKLTIPVQICKTLTFVIDFENDTITDNLKKETTNLILYDNLNLNDISSVFKFTNHFFIKTDMTTEKWNKFYTFIQNKGCIKYNFIINSNDISKYSFLLDNNNIYKWSKTSTPEKLMTFLNKNDSELYLDKFL